MVNIKLLCAFIIFYALIEYSHSQGSIIVAVIRAGIEIAGLSRPCNTNNSQDNKHFNNMDDCKDKCLNFCSSSSGNCQVKCVRDGHCLCGKWPQYCYRDDNNEDYHPAIDGPEPKPGSLICQDLDV